MRAVSGTCAPFSPSGYPEPSCFSWWWRMIGSTLRKDRSGAQIFSPITVCCSMIFRSSGVNGPGFSVVQLVSKLFQAQQGMHASQQLMLIHGLVEEIIGPAHDSVDAVGVAVQTGE